MFHELGIVTKHAAERRGDRVHNTCGRNEHRHRRRVLHQRPEAGLLVASHFEPSPLCQVTQAEEDGLIAVPVDRRADHLQKSPSRWGLGSDLYERACFFALHARQGTQDELQVVGVDQLERGQSDRVAERSSEHRFRGVVPPLQPALQVEDEHDIRKVVQEPGQEPVFEKLPVLVPLAQSIPTTLGL